MGSITKRLIAAVLAVAEGYCFGLGQGEFLWGNARAFMRSIAKRLRLGAPAGTPPVITGFQCQHSRLSVKNNFLAHARAITEPAGGFHLLFHGTEAFLFPAPEACFAGHCMA